MNPATAWVTVALVSAVTFACKGIGPFAIGERELPAPLVRVVALVASALLAALVVTSALAEGSQLRISAKTVGLLVAGLLLWRRAPLLAVVLAAAVTTAALRHAGWA